MAHPVKDHTSAAGSPVIRAFFDEPTNTVSYLVADPETREAAVIDPVLDYDHKAGTVTTDSVEAILAHAQEAGFRIVWALETHAHADHLSGAPYIKAKTGARIGIGEHIKEVQRIFRPVFNATDLKTDGSDFDHLFKDGERFRIGGIEVEAIYTPGHTPADLSYRIGDAVFVGDTLFMPDFGTARCDFPGGSAETMWDSIQKIMSLPDETRIFVGHDYKAEGRDHYAWETTVGAQKAFNKHVGAGHSKDDFVRARTARDATLAMPRLIIPSLQVNMRAGQMPKPEGNGVSYLKVPVNGL